MDFVGNGSYLSSGTFTFLHLMFKIRRFLCCASLRRIPSYTSLPCQFYSIKQLILSCYNFNCACCDDSCSIAAEISTSFCCFNESFYHWFLKEIPLPWIANNEELHFASISSRARRLIGPLLRLFYSYANINAIRKLYFTIVQPQIEYACEVCLGSLIPAQRLLHTWASSKICL